MPRGLAPNKRYHKQHLQLLRKAQEEIAEDEAMDLAIEDHRDSSLEELIEMAYPSVIDGPPDAVEVTLCPAI